MAALSGTAPADPLDACAEPPPDALIAGIDQFNRRAFYECHETLEAIWLADRRLVRRLYQGILQVGVAFYHLGRGNYRGATSLLASGLDYLQSFPPVCQDVDVARLIADGRRAQAALEALRPEQCAEFDWGLVPTIR
ncbi:MAG TPA: DUF309 domain-containing protein, partial [Dehalococcoidia bacterium]|nr:DUF309 domain-containing protein [Dehalococcoidia bacterium]